MTDQDDIRPWDCQPGETSKAYQAFLTYRDLGGSRTLEKAAQELGKSTGTIDRWAARWDWRSRCAAWDSMPSRKLEEAVGEAYVEMAARIAAQHERVATKLMSRLETHLDLLPEGKVPSQTWTLAHGAGRQGHQFATDLSKPQSQNSQAITDAIENLLNKLAGEE